MEKNIEKVEFAKSGYKNRIYMIIRYSDGSQYTKRLRKKDKEDLFETLVKIRILNKYKENNIWI